MVALESFDDDDDGFIKVICFFFRIFREFDVLCALFFLLLL